MYPLFSTAKIYSIVMETACEDPTKESRMDNVLVSTSPWSSVENKINKVCNMIKLYHYTSVDYYFDVFERTEKYIEQYTISAANDSGVDSYT